MITEKTKVILSDPQVLFREGIHFTLSGEDDFDVIGEMTSNEEALAFMETSLPNIAVLNMADDKIDGATATSRIKRNYPSVAVMLVANNDDDGLLFSAIKSGASAYLTKDADPDYLLVLFRVVAQGSLPIIDSLERPGVASLIMDDFKALAPLNERLNHMLARLSAREAEILSSLAAGKKIEQIAAGMGNSSNNEESIRRTLRLIVNKLNSNNQAQALIEAAQRGLPTLLAGPAGAQAASQYVTKAEFHEFQENLLERFKALIGGGK